MNTIKSFIKRNHIIAYLIMIVLLLVAGYCVKWCNYSKIGAILGDRAGTLYSYYNAIFLIILAGATLVFFCVVKKVVIEKLYAICAFVVGLLFMLAVTPVASADEDNHFYKCYDLSNVFFGYDLPEDEHEHLLRECDANTSLDKKISVGNYWFTANDFFVKADSTDMTLKYVDDVTYETMGTIYYFPAILGIIIGRLLNLGTVPLMMLSRLLMLLAYIFITYKALKKIPVFKPIFALVMLMPSVMARASSISQDGLLMAYTFVFVAYAVYYINNREKIKISSALIMIIAGLGMAVGKGGAYLPFLLLLFLIPKENFGDRIKYPFVVAASVILCGVVYLLGNASLFKDIAGSVGGSEHELIWTEGESYNIKYIISHPLRSFKVFVNSLFAYGGKWYVELIGSGYGWLQIYTSEVWVVIYTLLLFGAGLNVRGEEYCFNRKQKIATLGTVVFSSILVILSMWIFWTPVSSDTILGIQGRYFIPILLLVLMAFKNRHMVIKKNPEKILILMSLLVSIGTVFNIWTGMMI